MTLLQKIRSSLATQLALWVAGFVTLISGAVIFLLIRFSKQVVYDETVENIQQTLENVSQRISNTILQRRIIARLDKTSFEVDKNLVERLINESHYMVSLSKTLPHAMLFVTEQPAGNKPSPRKEGDNYIFCEPISLIQHSMTPSTTPVDETCQLALVISCPASDVYGHYFNKFVILLVIAIVGILILLFVCWKIINWYLRPLHQLADSAQRIADSHLNTIISKSRHQDEIGKLQNSLAIMQQSLSDYMKEMEQKHNELSQHNAELQKAYTEAQEYERLKAKFLLQMTGEMATSVETVCRHTDTINADWQKLSAEQMTSMQADILATSEKITHLLDELLNVPSQKRTFNITTNSETGIES